MPEEKTIAGGPVDLANRVLKELIRSPKFKTTIITILREMDPEAAPGLVRTLFWEDPLFFISVAMAIPDVVNVGLEGLREALLQLDDFPTHTLVELTGQIIDGVDGAALGEVGRRSFALWQKLSGEEGEELRKALTRLHQEMSECRGEGPDETDMILAFLERWIPAVTERAKDPKSQTSRLIKGINEILKENPDFLTHVLAPALFGTSPPRKPKGEEDRWA